MNKVLASITIFEAEDGSIRVGLDTLPDDDNLKKVQEVLQMLSEDIKNITALDVQKAYKDRLQKEISDKLNSLDIDKYINESIESCKEDILVQKILNGGK